MRIALVSCLILVAGCGVTEECPEGAKCGVPDAGPELPVQCGSTEYLAFDSSHHAIQDTRLAAFRGMVVDIEAAKAAPAEAAVKFAAAKLKYEDATHELRAKVQGRKDDHFADGHARRSPGAGMDALVMAGLTEGAAATTADGISAAKQKIEKTLVRFFYLSTFHELLIGAREKLDEGFGYYGSGRTNALASTTGISTVLLKRDGDNGTTLGADAFQALLDASCELAKAIDAGKIEPVALADMPLYKAALEKLDARMQTGLAYSATRYFHSPDDARGDRFLKISEDPAKGAGVAWATLLEGEMYFNAVEPYLLEAGGTRKETAEYVRAQLEAAKLKHAANEDWTVTIEDELIFDKLEAAFAIDVKKGG